MHSILCERALSSGAEVHFDTPVACVNPGDSDDLDDTSLGSTSSEGKPSITLANGEVIHADIIIGADGADSIVRPLVDEVLKVGEQSRTSIYHGSIPVATMQADPNMASIIRDLQSPHWLGTSSLVLCTYCLLVWNLKILLLPGLRMLTKTYFVYAAYPVVCLYLIHHPLSIL